MVVVDVAMKPGYFIEMSNDVCSSGAELVNEQVIGLDENERMIESHN
jgi:hypothetical protein